MTLYNKYTEGTILPSQEKKKKKTAENYKISDSI